MNKNILFMVMITLSVLLVFSKGNATLVYGTLLFIVTMIFGKEVEKDENE